MIALFILVRKIKINNEIELHNLYICLNKCNELISWNRNHKILYNSFHNKKKSIPFEEWNTLVNYILLKSPDYLKISYFIDY